MSTCKIKIDGSYFYNGHGGWAVVVFHKGTITNHFGHILTYDVKTTEKMALGVAMSVAPIDEPVTILTDCRSNVSAFEFPKPDDELDKEIASYRILKPNVKLDLVPRNNVKEAHVLAYRAGKYQHR